MAKVCVNCKTKLAILFDNHRGIETWRRQREEKSFKDSKESSRVEKKIRLFMPSFCPCIAFPLSSPCLRGESELNALD
jgi:hypothetical protein